MGIDYGTMPFDGVSDAQVPKHSLVWGVFHQTPKSRGGNFILRPGVKARVHCLCQKILREKTKVVGGERVVEFETTCSAKMEFDIQICGVNHRTFLSLSGHQVEMVRKPTRLPQCQPNVYWSLEWHHVDLDDKYSHFILHQVGPGDKRAGRWLVTLRFANEVKQH